MTSQGYASLIYKQQQKQLNFATFLFCFVNKNRLRTQAYQEIANSMRFQGRRVIRHRGLSVLSLSFALH